ncbi:hypothetical protein [uncultured Oscillibacter sp.]|uniref:hypothetical protein n=1 Tax=uncultured Oscillibacter sp. TaxID=876091 RepID=UPI0026354E1A|nr:hypothetical protein [uncultured Oscillibacter sp.]
MPPGREQGSSTSTLEDRTAQDIPAVRGARPARVRRFVFHHRPKRADSSWR